MDEDQDMQPNRTSRSNPFSKVLGNELLLILIILLKNMNLRYETIEYAAPGMQPNLNKRRVTKHKNEKKGKSQCIEEEFYKPPYSLKRKLISNKK